MLQRNIEPCRGGSPSQLAYCHRGISRSPRGMAFRATQAVEVLEPHSVRMYLSCAAFVCGKNSCFVVGWSSFHGTTSARFGICELARCDLRSFFFCRLSAVASWTRCCHFAFLGRSHLIKFPSLFFASSYVGAAHSALISCGVPAPAPGDGSAAGPSLPKQFRSGLFGSKQDRSASATGSGWSCVSRAR